MLGSPAAATRTFQASQMQGQQEPRWGGSVCGSVCSHVSPGVATRGTLDGDIGMKRFGVTERAGVA